MAPEHFDKRKRAGKLQFICPLCQNQQNTNTIKRIELRHHAQIALLTVTITYLTFPLFGWKGLMLYLIFWTAFEFFYRLRKRQALVCESCGFDPFLYRQDVGLARKALRQHWEKRIESENLFSGLKLKNYQTGRVNGEAENAASAPLTAADEKKAAASAPAKSP